MAKSILVLFAVLACVACGGSVDSGQIEITPAVCDSSSLTPEARAAMAACPVAVEFNNGRLCCPEHVTLLNAE